MSRGPWKKSQPQHARIAEAYRLGRPIAEIADEEGVCDQTVCYVARRAGLPMRSPNDRGSELAQKAVSLPLKARNRVAVDLVARGLSYGEAGKRLGLSRNAIAGLVYRAGNR